MDENVINSILLTLLGVPPPANIPRVLLEAPYLPVKAVTASPKSVAFPAVAMVIRSIALVLGVDA